jgi:acetylglutamate kinase
MAIKINYKIISAILVLIILVGAGFFAFNYFKVRHYNQGFDDAFVYMNNQIVNTLMQQGYLVITIPMGENQTEEVVLVPYDQNQGSLE